jgi:hypothetical protein
VTRHSGSVRKGYALIAGMFLSGILQNRSSSNSKTTTHPRARGKEITTEGVEEEEDDDKQQLRSTPVSWTQWLGGALAAVSLWMHTSYPPAAE